MTLINPISDKLHMLRLHGMLHAFKEQIENNDHHELSFEDRLALLVEREVIERENKALSARIGKARLRHQAELEEVRPSATRGLDKTTLKQLAQCEWVRTKRNIIITGPAGVGKTFLGSALARKACLSGYSSRYFRASSLASELETARGEGKLQRVVRNIGKFDVLVLDDFCLSAMSENEEKDLFEMIEERHGKCSTIITSQNPVNIWHGLMPNPAIADAILDRLVHGAIRVELKGESMRKNRSDEVDPSKVMLS